MVGGLVSWVRLSKGLEGDDRRCRREWVKGLGLVGE